MNTRIRVTVIFLALLLLISRNGISFPPVISPSQITSIDYVYERDATRIPQDIRSWLREVNEKTDIVASEIDDDTVDPSGNLRTSIKEAKKAGIPALVVMAGEKALKIVLNPQNRDDLKGIVPEVN